MKKKKKHFENGRRALPLFSIVLGMNETASVWLTYWCKRHELCKVFRCREIETKKEQNQVIKWQGLSKIVIIQLHFAQQYLETAKIPAIWYFRSVFM